MGDLQDVVIIDRGSADGLDKEMAVVTGDGIVAGRRRFILLLLKSC